MGLRSTNFHMAWCLPIYFAKKIEGARMNNLKVWPHLTIIAILVAVLAGVGVAWWMKRGEPTASAKEVPDAARIQRVEGDVA